MTTIYIQFILTAPLVLILSACSSTTQAPLPTETSQPTIAPAFTESTATSILEPETTPTFPPTPAPLLTPTPVDTLTHIILADTFFTGCAFLDKNANGLVDNKDASIGGIRFTVTLSGGMGFGDLTSDKDGCARVIAPGALPRESWPIVAQMEIPQTFTYVPIGDAKITLAYPDAQAEFLFSQP